MYTNISTHHTLEILHPFLSTPHLCAGCPANAIITALDILMQQKSSNLAIHFGRKTSTAVGTPPGVNYAKLYYGTWGI
jgi:hypothetical protein